MAVHIGGQVCDNITTMSRLVHVPRALQSRVTYNQISEYHALYKANHTFTRIDKSLSCMKQLGVCLVIS